MVSVSAIRTAFLVCCACWCSVSTLAEPQLRNIVTIPVKIAKDYLPSSIPAKPIDDGLRVCLVLPVFDDTRSAAFDTAVAWTGGFIPHSDQITEVDRALFNFAEPTASVLPGIVKRLFPGSNIAPSQALRVCDLVLQVSVRSSLFDNSNDRAAEVAVMATVDAIAADGSPVSTMVASGTGRFTKSVYWSANTRIQGVGQPALKAMLEKLVERLSEDPKLNAYIKTKSADRARPSDLDTTARFDDSASFFPNGRLDAGEQAKLRFRIQNRSAGPAFGVRLRISSATKGIVVPAETEVGDMLPQTTKDISVEVTGSLDVDSALKTLRVETLERRGYGGRPLVVELATAQLKKPTIEIADINLNDSGGRTRGDANGRPSNGETIEAVVLVRNSGPGVAVGARVAIEAVPGVELVDAKVDLPPIPMNGVREARFLLRLPVTFAGPKLSLTVRAEETRGAEVAQATTSASWPLEIKRPAIELTYRLFDGNSPASRGDRDGIANNGETLELGLTPVNRGALAARSVSIAMASRQPGLALEPVSFDVGELPPFSEGAERRVRIVVPRTFGRDELLDKLPLVATIKQLDFGPAEQPIALVFKVRRPELVTEVTNLSPLVEGTPATFALEIRNRGSLAAEGVRIEVTSDNSGVELLEQSGAPARKLFITVGTVAAQATTPRIQIKAHVRRNLAKAATVLDILVQQADFSAIATQAAVSIQREEVAVISTAPAEAQLPDQSSPRARAIPATISFQGPENGARINVESISLRFEVQSQSALEIVRVEQNHRVINASAPKSLRGQTGYVWQYEPNVTLDYGENVFEVVVVTEEGARTSRAMIVNRERPQGRLWVAAIGISKYGTKAVQDLQFAKEDASSVLAYYRQLGLPDEQMISLLDEQATLSNIKLHLGTDLVNKATNPDDTVILYFAGHGDRVADRASIDSDGYSKYLLPYGANPADLFSTALSMEDLSRIVARLRPERVVLIIDSCFSGAAGGRTVAESGVRPRSPISDEFLARLATAGKGCVILTATSGQEVANEGTDWHHGVFTYYLLEALSGLADYDHNGSIDVDEIYKYVAQKVTDATKGKQTPERKAPSMSGTLVVGKSMRP